MPTGIDAKLQPYLDAGAVFVALELLPDRDGGDIQPLHLRFPGRTPAIPLLPTAIAATLDMGVIAHLLGVARAVPVNYEHVRVNEAAIDWFSGGQNYADVVSQAVDEGGGRAFATDFAGRHGLAPGFLPAVPAATLARLRDARTLLHFARAYVQDYVAPVDADVLRVLAALPLPADVTAASYLACPQCYDASLDETPVDGAALAARLDDGTRATDGGCAAAGGAPFLPLVLITLPGLVRRRR